MADEVEELCVEIESCLEIDSILSESLERDGGALMVSKSGNRANPAPESSGIEEVGTKVIRHARGPAHHV